MMRTLLLSFLFLVQLNCIHCLAALQNDEATALVDRVEIRQGLTEATKIGLWNPLKVLTFEGQIESFDAKNLTIKVIVEGEPTTKTIASSQVQQIIPAWRSSDVARVMKLLEQRQFQEFAKVWENIDYSQIPHWQQMIVLIKVIQLRAANNDVAQAGKSFINLATENSIPDLYYAEMPLCWTTANSDEAIRQAAGWIESKHEVSKLLGASWLLMTQNSKLARTVLVELESSSSAPIAQLAKAQLWRASAVPDTMEQLPTWINARDRMLTPLALGPTEFMLDRLMRVEQYDLAVGCAARIATLHGDNYFRSKKALQTAATILKRTGKGEESDKIAGWIKSLDGTN